MIRVTEISATDDQIVITESYAVKFEVTGRGVFAEVSDSLSPFNGVYAFGTDKDGALAALATKISRLPAER